MEFSFYFNALELVWDVIPWAIGLVMLVVCARLMNRTGRRETAILQQLGLSQVVRDNRVAGDRFDGVFRGVAAGYATGQRMVTGAVRSTRPGVIDRMGEQILCQGSEYWVELDGRLSALAVVDREDVDRVKTAEQLVGGQPVTTGSRAFDRRFSVWCDDPAWARAVLDHSARHKLLSQPHVALFAVDDRVIFSVSRYGARELAWAHRLKLRGNGFAFFSVLVQRAEIFLNLTYWFSRRIAEVNASLDTVTTQVPSAARPQKIVVDPAASIA